MALPGPSARLTRHHQVHASITRAGTALIGEGGQAGERGRTTISCGREGKATKGQPDRPTRRHTHTHHHDARVIGWSENPPRSSAGYLLGCISHPVLVVWSPAAVESTHPQQPLTQKCDVSPKPAPPCLPRPLTGQHRPTTNQPTQLPQERGTHDGGAYHNGPASAGHGVVEPSTNHLPVAQSEGVRYAGRWPRQRQSVVPPLAAGQRAHPPNPIEGRGG